MNIHPQTFAAAQAGDPAALEQLLVQLQPDIRRYAAYQCRRFSAIDDVVQETLLILYRRVGSIKSVYAMSKWLLRVIARLCLLPALMLLRGTDEVHLLENSAHFSRVPTDELRIDLVRALESLPAQYREIIVLRDLQELTIHEIALALGISKEAAKSRLHRARTLIREYLLTGEDE
ncbi:RNA polymerase sigma factor [Noviherbaspirillum galbum]|uniref:Sigma-70 family RNA polymerase sigma factor n=1 Tax=Noviherbaspirillum galbum TaxID=2709383 RepID=A0A6B3SUZ4_9BURK|nr:sigma-70 family RNA polymerase sigma factor [Noviherbaspirillum galbum]NEX62192.1 sigma-70 family RNA polymerase sigma factor [Noviherbaspirillum galbum]